MTRQDPTCSTDTHSLGCGSSCGHCQTDQTLSLEHFFGRYPLLGRLAAPWIRILAGLLLFAGGLLTRGYSRTSLLLFLAGYLIVGTGVFIQAFAGALRGNLFSEHFLKVLLSCSFT